MPKKTDPNECPPLPPTRVRHRGDKIDRRGRVSALCFPKPRAIDMKRATWVMSDDAVTCPKCRALIADRLKSPTKEDVDACYCRHGVALRTACAECEQ
jgi:hypothetical protein